MNRIAPCTNAWGAATAQGAMNAAAKATLTAVRLTPKSGQAAASGTNMRSYC